MGMNNRGFFWMLVTHIYAVGAIILVSERHFIGYVYMVIMAIVGFVFSVKEATKKDKP